MQRKTNAAAIKPVSAGRAAFFSSAVLASTILFSCSPAKEAAKAVRKETISLPSYDPFDGKLDSSWFAKGDARLSGFRKLWMERDGAAQPFGMPEEILDSYSPEARREIDSMWQEEKSRWIVAFLSHRRVTPSQALEVHTPEEVEFFLSVWREMKKEAADKEE